MRLLPLLLTLGLTFLGASAPVSAAKQSPAKAAPIPAACSDFFGHINTPWLRAQPLPPGMDAVSRWSEMQGIAQYQALQWLDGEAGASPSAKQLANLMQAASGEDRVSMKPYLSRIAGLKKNRDVANYLAQLHAQGLPLLIDRSAPGIYVEGRGLLGGASSYASLSATQALAYSKYVEALAKAVGADAATANSLLQFEQSLFAAAQRDPKTYTRKDANKRFPVLRLSDYASAMGDRSGDVSVQSGAYFTLLEQRLAKQPVKQWQDLLRIWIAHAHAEGLSPQTRRARAVLDDALNGGQSAQLSDEDLLRQTLERAAAPLWNAAYVERLSGEQLNYTRQLADAIRAAAIRRIQAATWLDAAQRQRIEAKLAAVGLQIGALPNLSQISLSRDALAQDLIALRRWRAAQEPDMLTWLEAQTQPILAFDEKNGRILISAALAQSPVLFNPNVPTDYGAFGALLAQQFAQIALAEAPDAFLARGKKLVSQYNAYNAVGTRKVNGANTQRQNIADLMALEIAHDALRAKTSARDADRAFFAGWASVWARQDRDSALIARLSSMSHAPAKWRVNGPLANLPAFAQAYACKTGSMQRAAKDQTAILR